MTRLAIIHTTPATVDPLKALAAELLPGAEVVNFVDDSILPQLAQNGGDLSAVAERLVTYARFAQQVGAEAVLEACSSVGELASQMQAAVDIPIVRIDAAMAEAAVRRGSRVGVAATLKTTLEPTVRLLRASGQALGRAVTVEPKLIGGAYERLLAGDRDRHDALLVEALAELAPAVDVVVLAQASMARVLPRLPEADQAKVLTSPRLAMTQVRRALEARAA